MGGGIDGREKTSTMYCSDSTFTIYEFNNQKEVKMSDTNIKLELNAFEAGYLAGMLIKQMDERPEEKDFLEKIFDRLRNESEVFWEEEDDVNE